MKKQFFISLFLVFFFFLLFFAFCFFYNRMSEKSKKEPIVKFATSKNILITNKLPLSDTLGKKINSASADENIGGYVSFIITNRNNFSINYDIYLTKKDTQHSRIKDNYIKFYLTDSKDIPYSGFERNKIVSYNDLFSLFDKPKSKLLYKGVLPKKGSKYFKIRVWLSDSYIIEDYIEDFAVDVDVRMK